ncbi:MAG: antibiotic biosynthesis monooxygenase family protein [Pseudomonadota bacterium]
MTPVKRLAAAALVALPAAPAAAEVTLINVFEVPKGRLETVVEAWEKARDFLSQEPGYVRTALHQSLKPGARFELINVAVWESPEAFGAAVSKMRAAGVFPQIEGLASTPALYRVIRSDEAE